MAVEILLIPDASLSPGDLPDATIAAAAVTLQRWINAPHGQGPATAYSQGAYMVRSVPRGEAPPAPTDHLWPILLLAHSDAGPGVGGYHYEEGGVPKAKVFVVDCNAARPGWWSVAASHEIVEMLVDRWTNSAILSGYQGGLAAYQMEACDPCEQYSEAVGQFAFTEYVLPHYWRQDAPGPYSSLGHCTAPLTAAPGCRQAIYPLAAGAAAAAADGDAIGRSVVRLPGAGAR